MTSVYLHLERLQTESDWKERITYSNLLLLRDRGKVYLKIIDERL